MYGLKDAPLLWQLSLRWFLQKLLKGTPSHHDDCYFIFRMQNDKPKALGSAHVDDTAFTGKQEVLDRLRKSLEDRYGPVSRQVLPFLHVGVFYERYLDGFRLQQRDFALNIKPIADERGRPNTEICSPADVTNLRSALGALLYLCFTRADIMARVVLIASKVLQATVSELRECNSIIRSAHAYPDRGLVYRPLGQSVRLMALSDSSFSTSKTSYAVQGICVGLSPRANVVTDKSGKFNANQLNGRFHLLVHASNKSKRISQSTSHAESLALYNTCLHAEQIACRLTEQISPINIKLEEMIRMDEQGLYDVGIDLYTDCYDLLELITGAKGCPQDRSFRPVILALRERRLTRKNSSITHVQTDDMLANPLTKSQNNPQLNKLLTDGLLNFNLKCELRSSPTHAVEDYTEDDLLRMTAPSRHSEPFGT